jgi:hypothetical protein
MWSICDCPSNNGAVASGTFAKAALWTGREERWGLTVEKVEK